MSDSGSLPTPYKVFQYYGNKTNAEIIEDIMHHMKAGEQNLIPASDSIIPQIALGNRFDSLYLGIVESVNEDHTVTVRLEPHINKIYGESALSIWPRLARLEREINRRVTAIFQENPSLP